MLNISYVSATTLTTTFNTVWSGYLIPIYILFRLSTDDIIVSIFNAGNEVMTFDLSSMKKDYDLDSNAIQDPLLMMYSSNRWCLDFRRFPQFLPEGTEGIELKFKSKSGSKTLEHAMIMWSKR